MAISFQSLQNILPILVTSKLPVLIRGRHGIGKSQIVFQLGEKLGLPVICLLYTSPSPRDATLSRMPSSA